VWRPVHGRERTAEYAGYFGVDGYETCLADEGDSGKVEGFVGLDELRIL
jgi:hypothetical protein